ncbi:MAG: metal ABC transporter permease [Treponema sp.]|jgi:zinc transport system permease protein|nr:metal ABC transporter permease [Treponema sp.]
MADAVFSIFSTLREMFSYAFLLRAVIVGALVSLCAALLGVSLVLKRYSMIGDGLSHVGFGSLALATALNLAPLAVAIPVAIGTAFLLLRLGEKSLIKGDAAIAIVSTGSLALGVVIISQTTGMNTDVCNYLFGSILAMTKQDVYLSAALSIIVFAMFILFYHKIFAITFDETFARAAGIKTAWYNMLIAFLTAVTIVLGMRMMGAMLISALVIFPALTAMRVFKRFKSVCLCAVCVSFFCFFTGVVISYLYAIPTGASVVLMNIAAFVLFWAAKPLAARVRAGGAGAAAGAVLLLACAFLAGGCGRDRGVIEAAEQMSPVQAAAASPARESASGAKDRGKVIDIKEKMFIAQTNEVYLNQEDYLGKTLRLQGLFKVQEGYEKPLYFVIRYGPGCCGFDGSAGFEVAWDAGHGAGYPDVDAWVEATGEFKTYEEDGYPYPYIALSDLRVMNKRGAEYVSQ